jgi:hypothetical protein
MTRSRMAGECHGRSQHPPLSKSVLRLQPELRNPRRIGSDPGVHVLFRIIGFDYDQFQIFGQDSGACDLGEIFIWRDSYKFLSQSEVTIHITLLTCAPHSNPLISHI